MNYGRSFTCYEDFVSTLINTDIVLQWNKSVQVTFDQKLKTRYKNTHTLSFLE